MKKSMRVRAFLPALSLLATFNGYAENLPNDIVVTALRVPQKLQDAIADVTVISQEDLNKAGQSTVTELLAGQPGLQTVTYGGNSVFIRGAEARMTAVYLDGVRVDSQEGAVRLGGGAPWELIPLSVVDRIEIVRGPASAVYGSSPMGGVIQIFTKQGKAGQQLFTRFGVGSLGTTKAAAGMSGLAGSIDYAFTLGLDDTKGFNTKPSVVHTPNREPSTNKTYSGKVGAQLDAANRIEASVLRNQLDSKYVPWGGGTDYVSKATLDTSSIRWISNWTSDYQTKLGMTHSANEVKDDYPNNYRTTMNGVLFENQLKLKSGMLVGSYEQKSDQFDDAINTVKGERIQRALSLGYHVTERAHSFQISGRTDNDSIFGSKNTAGAGYAYAINTTLKATTSVATAFRSPTLEQTYSTYGSLSLLPETSLNRDVGLRYSDGSNQAGLVIYQNDFKNLISSDSSRSFRYFNIGQAVVQGATLSGATAMGRFNLRGSLDVMNPRDNQGRDLPLRARQSGTIGLDRYVDEWKLGGELLSLSERFDDAANTTRLGGYTLINLSATRKVSSEWLASFRLNNLTDKKYEQVSLMATPGRTIFVGLTWQANK